MAFPWMNGRQANRVTRQAVGSSRTEVEQLAVATAKTMISLEGRVRALEGVTLRTFLLPKGHSLGRAGVAAGAKYFEVVQAAGRNHTHGMPYQWIFAAILAAVEKIQMLIQEHAGGPQTFKDKVLWCTCKEQYKSEGYKLQITVTHKGEECMEMIMKCIQGTGGEEKLGPAPEGPAARHLTKLLKEMGQWEERA